MSEKTVKTAQKKPVAKIIRWILVIMAVIILEAGAIIASVKITESRGQADVSKLQNIISEQSVQSARIEALEKLPSAISTTTQQLEAATHSINIISEDLQQLTEETGNKKVPDLISKMTEANHRLEVLEETQNNEALILSIALMIKENALYHRSFSQEAETLIELSKNTPNIKTDAEVINDFKDKDIADNKELAVQYNELSQNLIFETKITTQEPDEDTISKGMELIKNTVSNMHFDRVIVLKKEKQSDHQKKLLATLNDLVQNYRYQEALDFIDTQSEFKTITNSAFESWQEAVKNKLIFDKALTQVITEQLSALRQDVRDSNIKMPKTKDYTENEVSLPEQVTEEVVE